MNETEELRRHILELLDGGSAHLELASVIRDFPLDKINARVAASPHTPWQLLEHIRIAQWDILEFSRNAEHRSPPWPDGYWPDEDATPETWKASADQTLADLQAMRELVADPSTDLFAQIPHGTGQTVLREAMLVADHTAYHLGQLVLLRKMLEA